MNKDISTAEAAVLGTVGFPLTIHRTICERHGESVSIHVADNSIEHPEMQARAVLREMRAGCLADGSPVMDAMRAIESRSAIVALLSGRCQAVRIEPESIDRWRIVTASEWQRDGGIGIIETPDIFMATTLAMMGFPIIGLRDGGGPALFMIRRYRREHGIETDGAKILIAIRDGLMPKNSPQMTWYLACWNLSEINRAIRESKAMLLLSRPGLTRDGKSLYAYVREDAPAKAYDKINRFFGN